MIALLWNPKGAPVLQARLFLEPLLLTFDTHARFVNSLFKTDTFDDNFSNTNNEPQTKIVFSNLLFI